MKFKFLKRNKRAKSEIVKAKVDAAQKLESSTLLEATKVPPVLPLHEQNDSEVLFASLKNPAAFNIIVERYQRLFVRKAIEITGNEDDAYDVVQNTFVRIYSGAKKFKPNHAGSFKSWAYTILIRQCYTLYRKQKRDQTFTVPLDPEFADIMPDESERRAYEHQLSMESALALLSQLPAKLRKVVELHFIQGKPQKEIASIENLSPVAVRARIHRAKSELRRLQTEMGLSLI